MFSTTSPKRLSRLAIPTVALAVALAIAGCGGSSTLSSSSATTSGGGTAPHATPVAVTASQLHALAKAAKHPIFWDGTAAGTYELTTIADGRTYIRYLPPGVAVGSSRTYLTIGTYARSSSPYAAVRNAGLAKHATIKAVGKTGELAVQYKARPQSVYLISPRANYEVEVYDPSSATAFRLATTGKIVPIP
jgi:hypothetical protein